MGELKIARNFSLPLEAVTQTFAILAKRGVGKTYLAAVMAEEMMASGLHVVIADPVGVWWGLRSSATGDKAGYPIIVFGGDHGDMPLIKDAGSLVADVIINEKIPAVLDFSLMRKGEQTKFMTDFSERLYHKNRDPLQFIMDESDAFAPQRPMPGEARLLGAVEDLVRRGRARGLGVTLITQRPAVLNKNVLTQIEVLISLRIVAPQDRKAIDEWIRVHGTPEQRKQLMDSLPSLPIGSAWFWSPGWLDVFKRIKVRRRLTFDSSATPKVGTKRLAPKTLADVDIGRLREHMAATVENAKAEDPKELRKEIARLQKELKVLKSSPQKTETIEIKVPVVSDALIASLDAYGRDLGKQLEFLESISNTISTVKKEIDTNRYKNSPQRSEVNNKLARSVSTSEPDWDIDLRPGAVRILKELASRYPAGYTKPQVGTLTGFKHKGGTFSTYISNLRSAGLIHTEGKLFYATETGIQYLGDKVPLEPKTHEEVMQLWQKGLRPGAYRMLEVIVSHGEGGISKQDLGEAVDRVHTGGTFGTYLSNLRSNGLIFYNKGYCVGSSLLFPT